MEKSDFERLSDKILIIALKKFQEELADVKPDMDDYTQECVKAVGDMIGIEIDIIDVDFLIELYSLNEKSGFSFPLKRPKVGLYSADIDIFETQYVMNTYRHKIYSYNKHNVISGLDLNFQYGGSVYDGYHVGSDVLDSETTDEKWDRESVKQIE